MNIMTWNTALTEGSNAKGVIEYVKEYLDKKDSIAVLQQIPYKIPDEICGWRSPIEDPVYTRLIGTFSEDKYKIFQNKNYNNGCIRMSTIIVTQMLCVEETNIPTTNREATIQIKDSYSIYGLHAWAGEDNEAYLNELKKFESADIVLGDFNAGDYSRCENRSVFREILKDYVCICNMPTKEIGDNGRIDRRSCIDHVFIKNNIVDRCSSLVIHEDINISDHYPISFCIE